MKKNPPAPKKNVEAATTTATPAIKGKGRASNGKSASVNPRHGTEGNEEEEEPFSEPDIPDGPEDEDIDEDEEAGQEEAEEEVDLEDQMELDEQELASDGREPVDAMPAEESDDEK